MFHAWKFCDYLCSTMWSYFHDPALPLPHSVKKTLHLGSKLTSICTFIHFFLSKDSAPLSCPQLRSRFAFSYVLQQDTYLGRKQCYLWWIFFPICGLLCWVYRAVISSREDRRVWGQGGMEGGVSYDTKKEHGKEHSTAECSAWNLMSVCGMHRLRSDQVAQGLHLDPVTALWGVCITGNCYYSLSLSFYYLNPNSCSRKIRCSGGPTPVAT